MKVDEAIEKLKGIADEGYGQSEITILSYADIEEEPDQLDDIEVLSSRRDGKIVKTSVAMYVS